VRQYTFSLHITPDSWSEFYRKPSSNVVATTQDGQTVQFKARHLQRHVTRDGIRGIFCLTIDRNNDFLSLDRL
jgi:hypothetical protein